MRNSSTTTTVAGATMRKLIRRSGICLAALLGPAPRRPWPLAKPQNAFDRVPDEREDGQHDGEQQTENCAEHAETQPGPDVGFCGLRASGDQDKRKSDDPRCGLRPPTFR